MRELIITRLDQIKKVWNGFPKGVERWGGFYNGEDTLNMSDIEYNKLSDERLVTFFELVIRQIGKQL